MREHRLVLDRIKRLLAARLQNRRCNNITPARRYCRLPFVTVEYACARTYSRETVTLKKRAYWSCDHPVGDTGCDFLPNDAWQGTACLGAGAMKEEQFNAIMFHLRAMLGLVCLQAGILLGFAWKYL